MSDRSEIMALLPAIGGSVSLFAREYGGKRLIWISAPPHYGDADDHDHPFIGVDPEALADAVRWLTGEERSSHPGVSGEHRGTASEGLA